MALFARRSVQEAIDRCAGVMPANDIARKVAELNASNESSLPAEWETMLTAAASRHCPLVYEPDLGGIRKADLLLMPGGVGTPGCLVEVTTISDKHAHAKNPYQAVCAAIRAKIRRLRGPVAGWHIKVDGKKIGKYGDAEIRLLLGDAHSSELFDQRFYDFVRMVRANPTERRVHQWKGDLLALTLTFDPASKGFGGGHLVYTVAHSLKRNPLARSLKSKTKQLGQTGHAGPCGVVICDGDCNVLSTRLPGGGSSFSLRDILCEHFKTDHRLSFVLLLSVEPSPPSPFGSTNFQHVLRATPFLRRDASPLAVDVLERLTRAAGSLPQPLTSPANAVRRYVHKYDDEQRRFPGGSVTMSQNSIKLSAHALLDILAGRKTVDEFFASYGDDRFLPGNFFARRQSEKRCIAGVTFTKGPGDNDEIEFVFGPPDAAVNRYRLPIPPRDGASPRGL